MIFDYAHVDKLDYFLDYKFSCYSPTTMDNFFFIHISYLQWYCRCSTYLLGHRSIRLTFSSTAVTLSNRSHIVESIFFSYFALFLSLFRTTVYSPFDCHLHLPKLFPPRPQPPAGFIYDKNVTLITLIRPETIEVSFAV